MSAMTKEQEQFAFTLDTATPEDFEAVKEIFLHVVDEGETYSYERAELTDEWIRHYWLDNVITTLVARLPDGKVAGVCAIRVNRTGRESRRAKQRQRAPEQAHQLARALHDPAAASAPCDRKASGQSWELARQ